MNEMERISVSSNNVASIGYDPSNSTLEVEFLNGNLYEYYNIPESVYQDFLDAPSKGTFLNQVIKRGGYSYSKK